MSLFCEKYFASSVASCRYTDLEYADRRSEDLLRVFHAAPRKMDATKCAQREMAGICGNDGMTVNLFAP